MSESGRVTRSPSAESGDDSRFPTRRDDEAGALKYLFASEDVLGAARLILRDGYFDNEVPIVTSASASGGSSPYTVLEGNRRVSLPLS